MSDDLELREVEQPEQCNCAKRGVCDCYRLGERKGAAKCLDKTAEALRDHADFLRGIRGD